MTEKTFCIFSANYLPNVGGLERYTKNLAEALAAQGDKVIIVTSNVFHLATREDLVSGVRIVRLPCYNLLKGRLPVSKKNKAYRDEFDELLSVPIDYVVVNTRFYRHSLEGLRLARAKGICPIVIDHGSAYLTLGNRIVDMVIAAYEHAITHVVKKFNPQFYAVSLAGSRWLKTFGIESRGVLNNSINAAEFRDSSSGRDFRREFGLSKETFVVSFVGRFIPEKGIYPLIEAARLLCGRDGNVVFFLAGAGPLGEWVNEQHLDNVHLVGKLETDDVAALIAGSDAFCLPTRSEGFSTSLLECAACGTAPVITNVGGVEELMPSSDYGCLLKEATAEEIVACIEYLAGSPERRSFVGENIRKRVEDEFSWDTTAEKVRRACELANFGSKAR